MMPQDKGNGIGKYLKARNIIIYLRRQSVITEAQFAKADRLNAEKCGVIGNPYLLSLGIAF